MRWILSLIAAVSLAGCSLFMQGPPSNLPPNQFPRCDDDNVFPALDASWAVLYLLSGAVIATEEGDDEEVRGALLVTGIGAVIFGSAAWHGFTKAKRCGQAKDAYRARYEQMQRQELAPPPPSSLPLGPPSSVPLGPPGGLPGPGPGTAPAPAPQ